MTSKQRIYFHDADPAGVLFFGRIFQVYHNAYEETVLKRKDSLSEAFNDPEYVLPIRHAEADYMLPIIPGEIVEIELQITEVRTSSFEITGFVRSQSGELKATVRTIHVCVRKKDWTKSPIPERWKTVLDRLRSG
jgi:1,4-dihydroxy-2-naphthoyl-CoA hydrolase